jgi:hypothetical protein
VGDVIGIIDCIRTGASVEYPVAALPDGLLEWRRRVQAGASRAGVKVAFRTFGTDMVTVFDPDYEPSADELAAIADVMAADVDGHLLSYEDALHARRRARLRVVREESGIPTQSAP